MNPDGGPGTVLFASTPIGNLGDASPRLSAALAGADVIAAEDTRSLRRLAAGLGIQVRGRVVSYHDAVEGARLPGLLAVLGEGRTVLVVTDAGTPALADPGYRLAAAAAAAGHRVSVLPGPSAVTAALVVSGLPTDRWCFEGFLPRRAGDRRRRLAALAVDPRTLVLFEAPHRLAATLADLAAAFGAGRPAALCREITKAHEEVIRAPVGDLAGRVAAERVRGEITLVVGGAQERAAGPSTAELASAVEAKVAGGTSTRDAVAAVAAEAGVPRRLVYQAAHPAGNQRSRCAADP
jgi:16S rRNA (cytidine1402-2'-O)-methyltransferase